MPNYVSPFQGLDHLGKQFFEVNPDAAYTKWAGAYGATATDNPRFYGYAQSLKDYFTQDYYGESVNQPDLQWTQYLDKLNETGKGLGNMWGGLTPSQRGENPGRYAPPVKWVS